MCRRGESYCSEFNEHWRTCVACGAKGCENFDKDCGFYEGAFSLPCNNCAALLCGDCNVHVYHCGMCNEQFGCGYKNCMEEGDLLKCPNLDCEQEFCKDCRDTEYLIKCWQCELEFCEE